MRTVCPVKRNARRLALKFHTRTVLSSEPEASCLRFGLKETLVAVPASKAVLSGDDDNHNEDQCVRESFAPARDQGRIRLPCSDLRGEESVRLSLIHINKVRREGGQR